MARTIKGYGWIPDLPDHRDLVYSAPRAVTKKLPAKTDLRPQCPPVYDQGELGSCTANAIGAAHQFEQLKQEKVKAFVPSRLFIYYNERAIEGTVDEDSGAMIRDGIKTIAKQGVCPEPDWAYNLAKYRTKPPKKCYTEALQNQALTYYAVRQDLTEMKGCLASGYPFVFGFSVYESFESATVAKTGKASMPKPKEKQLGGHAVMAVGYDDAQKRFIVRNSWGTQWGLKGYFTLPYEYLLSQGLAADFWTVRLVE